MATLPRSFSTGVQPQGNGAPVTAAAAAAAKHKKSKKISWTLGRKKSRDEAFVADRSGKGGMRGRAVGRRRLSNVDFLVICG